MRARTVISRVLDVFLVVTLAVLAIRLTTGTFDFREFGLTWPRLSARRVSRILYALLGLSALRVLVEVRPWSWLRPGRWLARIAFGRGEDGSWPLATTWWVVLPVLFGAAGATFGLAHAGWHLIDRVGAFDDATVTATYLLSWILRTALLGLSLGAGWTLLLALGRMTGKLPPAGRKDLVLTILVAGFAATAYAWGVLSDWTYPTRLGEANAGRVAAGFAVVGALLFGVVYPALARRSQLAVGIAAGLPVLAIVGYGILGPGATQAPEGRPPRHVVLVSIDTLRADHLGCYGYDRPTSPEIDRLASEGVRFERAFAPQSSTDPSHTTMFTGVYSREHGVRRNGFSIANPDTPSLPEWFRSRGFQTAAIASRSHLNPDDLLLPGFDFYSAPTARKATGDAKETYDRAAAWIERHAAGDFFMWVHFWDPHNQYRPPPDLAEEFAGEARPDPFRRCGWQEGVQRNADDIRYRAGLYDGEIRDADRYLGKLVRLLEEVSPDEPPLIVIVGDHGEILTEYWEPYEYCFDHSWFVNDALLRIPLIFWWKGRIAPRTVPDLVETTNLAATIAALADPAGVGARAGDGKYLPRKYVERPPPEQPPAEMVGMSHLPPPEPEAAEPRFYPTRAVQLGGRATFQTWRRTPWYEPTDPFVSRGESLVPLLEGKPSPIEGLAYSFRLAKMIIPKGGAFDWLKDAAFTVRDRRWRYVVGGRDGEALYDQEADPAALRNVIAEHPEVAKRLAEAIKIWKLRVPERPPDMGSLSDEKHDAMTGLGYVE